MNRMNDLISRQAAEEKYFKIAEERIEEAVNDLPYRANRLKKNAEVADYDK